MQNTKKMETVSKKNEAETEDVRILREETKKALKTFKSGKTKRARFEKRNVQKSRKTKRSKNFAHTTL